MRGISELTEKILQDDPRTRYSDKWLQVQVLNSLGFEMTEKQMEIWRDISLESIRRTRAKLQNVDGKYLPDPEIVKERKFRGLTAQQRMPGIKAKHIDRII